MLYEDTICYMRTLLTRSKASIALLTLAKYSYTLAMLDNADACPYMLLEFFMACRCWRKERREGRKWERGGREREEGGRGGKGTTRNVVKGRSKKKIECLCY